MTSLGTFATNIYFALLPPFKTKRAIPCALQHAVAQC